MLDFTQNCLKFLFSLFKNIIYKKKIFYVIEYKNGQILMMLLILKNFSKSIDNFK